MVNETERTVRRAGAATAKELRDEEARLFWKNGVPVDLHPRARGVAGSAEGIALLSHGEQRTIALRHLLESLDSIRQAVTQAFATRAIRLPEFGR